MYQIPHINVIYVKRYFIDTIRDGGDKMYTSDEVCKLVDFLIDNIFVKSEEYIFVGSSEVRLKQTVLHCEPNNFFTLVKKNFWIA